MLALKIPPNASKLARAGHRIDTSFSSYCTTTRLQNTDDNVKSAELGVVLGFPIWGLEFSTYCEVGGPCLMGRPCWLLAVPRWVSILIPWEIGIGIAPELGT